MNEAATRPLWKNPFLVAFFIGASILTVLPFMQDATLRAPDPIGPLGSWTLTDEHGKPYGSADLKGKVWVASFFFSRCPSVCPKQQQALLSLLPHVEDLRGRDGMSEIALVSFTVDPGFDTPPVLEAYSARLRPTQKAAGDWKLLTGTEDALKDLLVKHFLVVMGERTAVEPAIPANPELYDIAHTAKFALVDQNGDLRGFWSTDDLGQGNLINAARLLAKKGPRP